MPEPGADELLVRVRATGICGSDVHGFLGHSPRRKPGLILGHEVVGIVESSGPLQGQRVAVNPLITCGRCRACLSGRQNVCVRWRLLGMDQTHGGFAEFLKVPERSVHALPEHVTDAAAVMIEPLANAFHLVSHVSSLAGLLPTAIILGGGTLGACILVVAKARGIRVLFVTEPNERRAEVARRLGVDEVLDPSKTDVVEAVCSRTEGLGVDVVFEAVGAASTRLLATKCVARGGTVLLLGLSEDQTTLPFQELVRNEVRLQTSFAYTESDFAEAVRFVIEGRVDFSPWTDVRPLEEGQACFDKLVSDPGDRIKIALTP